MQVVDCNKLGNNTEAEILFVEAFCESGGKPTSDGLYNLEFSINGKEIDWKDFCKRLTVCYSNARRDEVLSTLNDIPAFTKTNEVLENIQAILRVNLATELEKQFGMKPGYIEERLRDRW